MCISCICDAQEATVLNSYLDDVTDRKGTFLPARMSESLRIPLSHLARIAQVHRNSLSRHPASPAVQLRLGQVARVIATASDLLEGDTAKALVWFRHQPLSGFDGQTAEELVADGHSAAVLAHLETLRDGGYA
jgi:uncharacterized protein (DUF2384 family)